MKKILYTLIAGAMALNSCSKEAAEELVPQTQTQTTTFTLAVDGAITRTTSNITPARYVMEVWSEDGTKAEKVFENNTKNHAEITSGASFTVNLDKTKAYTCLFWADDNTTFNAASLKAISLNANKEMAEAYHAKVIVAKGKNPAVTVTLKRAVAKITLTETSTVKTTENLALKLTNIYPTFSVLTGAATGTAAEWVKTVKPAATTGVIGTFYFFAKANKELSDLRFTYATADEKTVTNIPVQQNFATNIKGQYSNISSFTFTVTADDEWKTPDNEVVFPLYKVGDLYPDASAPIGVVFWVDATHASYNSTDKTSGKGKILGLTHGELKKWGPHNVNESATVKGIRSLTDGLTATRNMIIAHKDDSTFSTDYSAFEWIYNTINKGDIDGRWYIPAKNEWIILHLARNEVNVSLNSINGALPIGSVYYWTSTEYGNNEAWYVDYLAGVNYSGKYNLYFVRAIAAF